MNGQRGSHMDEYNAMKPWKRKKPLNKKTPNV